MNSTYKTRNSNLIKFIIDEKLMKREMVLPLFNEAHELSSIFITTRKTAQSKA